MCFLSTEYSAIEGIKKDKSNKSLPIPLRRKKLMLTLESIIPDFFVCA